MGLGRFGAIVAVLVVSACASAPPESVDIAAHPRLVPSDIVEPPRIVGAPSHLQCVPYARQVSGIDLRGDAWTWWDAAAGRFYRGHLPAVGSVLVLSRTNRNPYGHLAVVTHVIGPREIIVSHANWLNRGQIHQNTPAIDVSEDNDWSEVRFWYTPGGQLGVRTYPVSGFIYPPADLPPPGRALPST